MRSSILSIMRSRFVSRSSSRGQAMVELAIAVPVLALLLLVACDFARAFFLWIELNNAARAGVQYGAQTLVSAADIAGMQSAAAADAMDISGMTVTPSQCTCISGTGSVVPICPSGYCSSSPKATFVEVDTTATFHTLINYPGIPSSTVVTGKAVMQVSTAVVQN